MDPQPQIAIRWMTRRDLPEIRQIEQDCFADPWPENTFVRWLRRSNVTGRIADVPLEQGQLLAGYLLQKIEQDHLELIKLAVRPDLRRQRVATALVQQLISKHIQGETRYSQLRVLVPESNLGALKFFQSQGLRAQKLVRQPWEGLEDDGIQMVYWRRDEQRQLAVPVNRFSHRAA